MPLEEQREQLMEYTDLLKLSLAGNLKHYSITDRKVCGLTHALLILRGAPAVLFWLAWQCARASAIPGWCLSLLALQIFPPPR